MKVATEGDTTVLRLTTIEADAVYSAMQRSLEDIGASLANASRPYDDFDRELVKLYTTTTRVRNGMRDHWRRHGKAR